MKQLSFTILAFTICGVASGQVFTINPAAGNGVTGDDNAARYGAFGLNSATDPAYNIYRKYGERGDPDLEGTKGANTDGNLSSMEWTEMFHSGGTGIIDPGMWIATSPGTSSPADELLYFKPAVDEEGGGVDDNNRRDWDVRFGFLEDPNAFIDSREPNDESWDLWSGEWSTDGISSQANLGTNELNDESDWYVRGGNFRLNAKDSVFNHEGSRDAIEWESITYLGSGDEVEPFDGPNSFAGVGYNDAIEISWNMELNDPDNADPDRAREVRFSLKTGSILREGVFDPGDANNEVAPNLGDEEPYSDGFFDWQNATPVFFVAPTGGGEASGTMGVFIPGDLNADGTVDDADRAIITAHMDQVDTSYSRGDVNQDGVTNAADLEAWEGLGGNPQDRIDSITDLNERIDFVHNTLGTWMGDSNFDGEFNSSDFVAVFTAGLFETGEAATWATGDWNGDGVFGSGDFVVAFTDGGFEVGPRVASVVPEPSSIVLAMVALVGILRIRRK